MPQELGDKSIAGHLILAFSLANICVSNSWRKLMYGDPLWMPYWPWRFLLAMALTICLLAACFLVIDYVVSAVFRRERYLHALGYLVPFLIGFMVFHWTATRYVVIALVVSVLVIRAAIFVLGRRIMGWTEKFLIGMIILLPINYIGAAITIARQGPRPSLASPLPPKPDAAPRVVWIIFDETDFNLAFPGRPAGLELPNFDRLRGDTVFAEDAVEAGHDTFVAVPALVTGLHLRATRTERKDELLVEPDKGREVKEWDREPNVFDTARALGFNVGAVAWALPYCRIFETDFTSCYWESYYTNVRNESTILENVRSQLMSIVTPFESRLMHRYRYPAMLTKAKEYATDRTLGFVLLHMSVPHAPSIYDRARKRMTSFNRSKEWYPDGLSLADRTLGEIRSAMEAAGEWDRSTVIVTSDHSLRQEIYPHTPTDTRVPYMVKVRGQHEGYDFTPQFSAVVTRSLIEGILSGKIVTREDVVRSLAAAPVPN